MALLFIDSFDHYQTADMQAKWSSVFAGGIEIIAGGGRCGSQALQLGGIASLVKGIPFASDSGTWGFAFRPDVQLNDGVTFARVMGMTGEHMRIARNIDGSISLYRFDGVVGGELKATSAPDLLRMGQYYYIEWGFTLDNAAGTAIIKINGATVITFNGQTRGFFGGGPTGIGFQCSGNTIWSFDDLYVLDNLGSPPWNTFLGDCKVEYLRPDGPGFTQEWDLVGGATHWQAVDDNVTPDGDATYIKTTVQGLQDLQTYGGTGLPSGSIFGLQVNLYARKTDSGARSIAPLIRIGGVTAVGQNFQPSFPDYIYQIQVFPLNPVTGLAWAIADVNAAEVGVLVTV
jgi:hypothetical protein